MIAKLLLKLRDWWRGYTEADVRSVQKKVCAAVSPRDLFMTPAEWRAWHAVNPVGVRFWRRG